MNIGLATFENISPALACIYSLPRSGSTVLITELDRLKGIVCLPESYFPQILELLSPDELSDPSRLAAFFLASSPSGSLLSFEEAQACMVPADHAKTLVRLGLACALKTNREPSQVAIVIWKTTRIVSRWKLFAEAGGRFLVLRRNPLNVFESQFRVDFGYYNRNPLRFAAFQESYEAIFSRLPIDITYSVDYESIPEQLTAIQSWLGVGAEHWIGGESSMAKTHAKEAWHSGLMDGFQSHDSMKRQNISTRQRLLLKAGQSMAKPIRPILVLLRDYYDRQIMKQIRIAADEILLKESR
ncbi:MAG: hypothetical protein Q8K18_09790 [Burkholderiales bacterium]|nr:hypothetical protein [Burkholderiales bacterium]